MCDHAGVTPAERLAEVEARYHAARDARDRLDVARATGLPVDTSVLDDEARDRSAAVRAALDAFPDAEAAALRGQDRRALQAIGDGIEAADAGTLSVNPPISRFS